MSTQIETTSEYGKRIADLINEFIKKTFPVEQNLFRQCTAKNGEDILNAWVISNLENSNFKRYY